MISWILGIVICIIFLTSAAVWLTFIWLMVRRFINKFD